MEKRRRNTNLFFTFYLFLVNIFTSRLSSSYLNAVVSSPSKFCLPVWSMWINVDGAGVLYAIIVIYSQLCCSPHIASLTAAPMKPLAMTTPQHTQTRVKWLQIYISGPKIQLLDDQHETYTYIDSDVNVTLDWKYKHGSKPITKCRMAIPTLGKYTQVK